MTTFYLLGLASLGLFPLRSTSLKGPLIVLPVICYVPCSIDDVTKLWLSLMYVRCDIDEWIDTPSLSSRTATASLSTRIALGFREDK